MNDVLIEMAKQVPSALAVIGTVFLFLRAAKEERAERANNAKEATELQRGHDVQMQQLQRSRELEVNNLWATTVKNVVAQQDTSYQAIVSAIKDMHEEMNSQYEKMGITKDLYDAAKKVLNKSDR
jgi:hypothetical protein